MPETSIAGEITQQVLSFKEVTWKIRKLFSLSSEEGYKIRSPPFYFVGVNCNLSVCPNGTKTIPGDVIIHLFLRMADWKHENPPVICEIGLRSNDGTIVKSIVTEKNLMNGTFMSCQFNKKEIINNDKLFGLETEITIFCKLTIGDTSRVEKFSQTEPQLKSAQGEWFFPEIDSDIEISCPKEACIQTEQRCIGIEKVLHDFKNLLESEADTDVVVRIKGKEFKVHRGILGTRTPVFAAMFKHDMSEKCEDIVTLDDCEPDIFHDFLCYVYTGSVNSLSEQNVFGLYEISDKYQVEDLKEECLDCLKIILSIETFCDIISLALKYNERNLLQLAIELFCEKMKDIIITREWQEFLCRNPTYVNELLMKRMEHESKSK